MFKERMLPELSTSFKHAQKGIHGVDPQTNVLSIYHLHFCWQFNYKIYQTNSSLYLLRANITYGYDNFLFSNSVKLNCIPH